MQKPTRRELQIKSNPEVEDPNILFIYLFSKISELMNNKSSKIEYKELSMEENRLENKLLIVSVMVCTIFIC